MRRGREGEDRQLLHFYREGRRQPHCPASASNSYEERRKKRYDPRIRIKKGERWTLPRKKDNPHRRPLGKKKSLSLREGEERDCFLEDSGCCTRGERGAAALGSRMADLPCSGKRTLIYRGRKGGNCLYWRGTGFLFRRLAL